MKDDVLQRAMFAGNMAAPVPPTADGVGITSGLDAPMPMPEPTPQQDMQQTLTGLEQVGGMIQNMQQGVDSAEDFESMMNAMRSDEQPIEARRAELASMVGKPDATATPESVLTLLQPTFEMLETLEQSVPQGGIGGMPVEADPMMPAPPMPPDFPSASSEYIQAPGTEEAMARMAMGEQPVNRRFGSPSIGEQNPYLKRAGAELFKMPIQSRIEETIDTVPRLPNFTYGQRYTPDLADMRDDKSEPESPKTIDLSMYDPSLLYDPYQTKVKGMSEEYLRSLSPDIQRELQLAEQYRKATDPILAAKKTRADTPSNLAGTLSEYVTAPRTTEQIQSELGGLYGTADQDALKTQTGLALARYFSQVPGEGTLLQNLVRPAGAFAEDLSKITAQKAALDRELRTQAYTTAQAEKEAFNKTMLELKTADFTLDLENKRDFETVKLAQIDKSIERGIVNDKETRDRISDELKSSRDSAARIAALGEKTYVKYAKDPDGSFNFSLLDKNAVNGGLLTTRVNVVNGKRVQTYTDENDQQVPVPADFVPASAADLTRLGTTTDKDSIITKNYVVVGADGQPMEVSGYYNKVLRTHVAQLAGGQEYVLNSSSSPYNYYVEGKLSDMVRFSKPMGGSNRIFATMVNPQDPLNSYRWQVGTDTTGDGLPDKTFSTSNIDQPLVVINAGQAKQDPANFDLIKGLKDIPDNKQIRLGSPYVEKVEFANAVNPADIDNETLKTFNRRVLFAESSLGRLQEIQDLISPHTVGPVANIKALMSSHVAPFLSEGAEEAMTEPKIVALRENLEFLKRELVASTALSPRYAVREMEILMQLVGTVDGFVQNKREIQERMAKLARIFQNDRAQAVGRINGEASYNRVMRKPTATVNDPLNYLDKHDYVYLRKLVKSRPDMAKNLVVVINAGQAKQIPAMFDLITGLELIPNSEQIRLSASALQKIGEAE